MDRIGHEQHPDATAEIGQRLGQALAVLATLGEAAARLAAAEIGRRERLERQADRVRPGDHPHRTAVDEALAADAERRRAARRDRRLISQTLDPDWLGRADLLDLASVWRAARLREDQFPEARVAALMTEERLREVYPRPMDLYDQAVAAGASPAAAMRVAAQEMAHTPVMRPHGGRRSPALQAAAGYRIGGEAFDRAVGAERADMASGVPASRYLDELEALGVGGHAAAQALREILAAQAMRQPSTFVDAVTRDDQGTSHDNDHASAATPGMAAAARDAAGNSARRRTAAQLAAQWYPNGIGHPVAIPAHVAARRPANAPTHIQTATSTMVRSR